MKVSIIAARMADIHDMVSRARLQNIARNDGREGVACLSHASSVPKLSLNRSFCRPASGMRSATITTHTHLTWLSNTSQAHCSSHVSGLRGAANSTIASMNPQPVSQQSTPHSPTYPPPPSAAGQSATSNSSTPYATSAANLAANTAAAALSQHSAGAASENVHIPTPNNAASGGRKRRAHGAPGSRGVANLTPEQLAKKRANDREAQRAIRERTRTTIESLERRIRELESQQPFQDLQRVLQERDRALAECEDLKRRLAAVAGLVGAAANPAAAANGGPGLNELAALTAQQSPLPPLQTQTTGPYAGHGAQYDQPLGQNQSNLHPDLRSPAASGQSPTSQPTPPSTAPIYQAGEGRLRRWSPSLDHPPQSQHTQANGFSPPTMPTYRASDAAQMHGQTAQQGQQHGERHGLSYIMSKGKSSQSPPLLRHEATQYHGKHGMDKRLYTRLPVNVPSETPIDSLLLDFLKRSRKQIADGVPPSQVAGPAYPSLSVLCNPETSRSGKCHPLSAFFIDIISKFPDLDATPEKVAVLHIMFTIMRWMVYPCEETYLSLPEWARPVQEQLDHPHNAWYDYLPWPIMRRRLSLASPKVVFDDFFVPYTTTLSLNWPYPPDQVFMTTNSPNPDDGSHIKMNPVFESHLMSLDNWSLGPLFKRTHPELCDETVRIEGKAASYGRQSPHSDGSVAM